MKVPVELRYVIEVDMTDEDYTDMKRNKKLLEDTIRTLMFSSVEPSEVSPVDFRKIKVNFPK